MRNPRKAIVNVVLLAVGIGLAQHYWQATKANANLVQESVAEIAQRQ